MPWRALIGKIAFLMLMLPAALFSAAAGAEVLDELTVFQERTDAVVRITFGARASTCGTRPSATAWSRSSSNS